MDAGLASLGADTESLAYSGGKLGAEIAGTLGVGGASANALSRVPQIASKAPGLINSIRSAGMATGAKVAPGVLPAVADVGLRAVGGGVTGGLSAGLVDPEAASTGAVIGAALPPVLKGAGKIGGAIGKVLRGGGVSDDVAALATRAKELGIDIPADRLVNSRPMNALASGLNYVPFSGRAATERTMENQLNAAASRLVGENSPNMTKALRDASKNLGAKFESTLQNNIVKVDPKFMNELADAANTASRELGSDGASIISKQVDDIIAKAATGEIDGKAAYNIKKTLDRIGNRNSSEAHYARELKRSLMGALDRSLGADEAAAFAKTRQQYGNMLDLERLAKNGAEGEISVARLANMRDIGNEPMQELADIAAQFVKARESQHGAMQRGFAAVGIGGAAGLPALGATIAGGRLTNSALNSNALRNFMVNGAPESVQRLGASPELNQLIYRAAPVVPASLR
jgi:hypothetical protein